MISHHPAMKVVARGAEVAAGHEGDLPGAGMVEPLQSPDSVLGFNHRI